MRSAGSSNSKMQLAIMLVPKVAMRQPTAGPTASVIVRVPAPTERSAPSRSARADAFCVGGGVGRAWRKHYIRERDGVCPKLSANGR